MKQKKVKKKNNNKSKLIFIIIIILMILSVILTVICRKVFYKNEKKETINTSYFDDYIDKINEFNEVFTNFDFNELPVSEEDPAEDWRCIELNEELANQYIETFDVLYGETSNSFINLIIRIHRDGTESKSITLCKPLNCDITPISKDLYHYKEEDGKKYLEIGEEGKATSYELEEQDGKLKPNIPIVYCPTYID